MSELIDRQALKNKLKRWDGNDPYEFVEIAFWAVDNAPTIDAAAAIEALQAELAGSKDAIRILKHNLEMKKPKRGEWVEDTTTYYAGPGMSNYKCSLCGKICGTWRRGLKPSELPNWCGNCGAKMTEVQDG